jgi:hypothetical protein
MPANFMEPLDDYLAGEVFGVDVTEGLEILNPTFSARLIFEAGDMKSSEEFNPVSNPISMLTSSEHLRITRPREAASTQTGPFIFRLF